MQNSSDFVVNKVQCFKNSVSAMLRDAENIMEANPTLRSVFSPGEFIC